jgi:hypothetical protein
MRMLGTNPGSHEGLSMVKTVDRAALVLPIQSTLRSTASAPR